MRACRKLCRVFVLTYLCVRMSNAEGMAFVTVAGQNRFMWRYVWYSRICVWPLWLIVVHLSNIPRVGLCVRMKHERHEDRLGSMSEPIERRCSAFWLLVAWRRAIWMWPTVDFLISGRSAWGREGAEPIHAKEQMCGKSSNSCQSRCVTSAVIFFPNVGSAQCKMFSGRAASIHMRFWIFLPGCVISVSVARYLRYARIFTSWVVKRAECRSRGFSGRIFFPVADITGLNIFLQIQLTV